MQGHLRWTGLSGEFWQNVIHQRRERQTTPVFLSWEPHENHDKAERYDSGRWATPRSEGVQYVTGDEQKAITNSSRKNEVAGPNRKRHSVVDVSSGESKVRCCKEQYYIGTWNVRSMNQGKLDVVKQEMARRNINILAISEIKWTGMGKFNSDDHYIYHYGQESLRRNRVALIVNKRVWNAVLGCNLKNDRMISVSKANHSISQ